MEYFDFECSLKSHKVKPVRKKHKEPFEIHHLFITSKDFCILQKLLKHIELFQDIMVSSLIVITSSYCNKTI